MFRKIRNLFHHKIKNLNIISIYRQNILHNIKLLQDYNYECEIFPILKSNAYGHGLEQMCMILNKTKLKFICVDSYPEYQIVKTNSNKKILILGETWGENYKYFDHKICSFAIYNIENVTILGKHRKKVKIHLFLNTGMNREGVKEDELLNILETLKQYKHIKIEGVMSHFHSADELDSQSLHKQVDIFKSMLETIKSYGHKPRYKHIANSAGFFRIKDPILNAARVGLSIYGYSPFSHTELLKSNDLKLIETVGRLKPALCLSSTIVGLQDLHTDDGVSYNQIFKAKKKQQIATIPFGYKEGLSRNSSGKLFFKYKDKFYPQIGNICMNICSCQADKNFEIFDQIDIIGLEGKNSIYEIADTAQTIEYEVLVKLDPGIRREVIFSYPLVDL